MEVVPEDDSVYLPDPVEELEQSIARPDIAGDRPLLPQWIRTKAGRQTKRRAMTKQARRALRKWLARQRTTRGHAAQAWRGIRRSHDWMVGFEGIHIQAAKHEAHVAVREARDLARRARYTFLPGDRAQAQSSPPPPRPPRWPRSARTRRPGPTAAGSARCGSWSPTASPSP
ncbi:hypothetical protein ACFQZC_25445 [Streptacidiphilus monticola]